jgi:hypothetical protein
MIAAHRLRSPLFAHCRANSAPGERVRRKPPVADSTQPLQQPVLLVAYSERVDRAESGGCHQATLRTGGFGVTKPPLVMNAGVDASASEEQ